MKWRTKEECFFYRHDMRKTAFWSHLDIKMIILPRQARDKHRENSKKDAVFRTAAKARVVATSTAPHL
jgi:hypothetical protein